MWACYRSRDHAYQDEILSSGNFRTLLLCAAAGMAQSSDDAAAIRHEHWVVGVLASGGSGLFDRDNVQFVRAGVRVGRVMTGELGKGWLRGTFEEDVEIMPLDYVLWGGYKNVYGFGVNPLVMKWNFTRGRKVIPYFLAQGGMLEHLGEDSSGRHLDGELHLRAREWG